MKIAVLAGGVGGARFVRALTEVVDPRDVAVIANVGDDLEVHGLRVSPDLDTLLYTLSGLGDDERGWGRAGETWNASETVELFGGETWFRLGDRDIGLHLLRSEALRRGEPLSAVTARLARSVGLEITLLPATDDRLRTRIRTPSGEFEFQEWFVQRGHRDEVNEVAYDRATAARPAPGVLEALEAGELIAIAPSNPFVSIGPILAVREIRAAVEARRDRVVLHAHDGDQEVLVLRYERRSLRNRVIGGEDRLHPGVQADRREGLIDGASVRPVGGGQRVGPEDDREGGAAGPG